MTNVSAVTKHFPSAEEGFTTTLSSTISAGATTVGVNSLSGYTTGEVATFVVAPTVASEKQVFTGVVDTAGLQLTNVVWTTGTNQTHAAGTTVVDYATATHISQMSKGILAEHNQDGSHGAVTASSVASSGAVSGTTGTFSSDVTEKGSTLTTIRNEHTADFVASGCVWTGDAYGSTRAASMTAGVVYVNGKRVSVSAVTARSFTASKDTYIDIDENGTISYTEVTNNAASPALTANYMRIGIIVTGASNIANAGSINQGEENKVLPIASSIPYAVTDSLGNLICPRDPQRKVLGYRIITTDATTTTTANYVATNLSCPVIVPTGRKVKVTFHTGTISNDTAANASYFSLWDGVVNSGTQVSECTIYPTANAQRFNGYSEVILTPTATSKTYNVGIKAGGGTARIYASSTAPALIKVELV